MDKKSTGIISVCVILIIAVVVYLGYTYSKNNENEQNNSGNNVIENTANEVTNEVTENIVENQAHVETQADIENADFPDDVESEISTANDEEKAMNIAKNAWGDTDGVYFNMEGVNSNGDYRISVTENARVLAWYYVNASKGTYNVEYN